jgi:hypothetical protein
LSQREQTLDQTISERVKEESTPFIEKECLRLGIEKKQFRLKISELTTLLNEKNEECIISLQKKYQSKMDKCERKLSSTKSSFERTLQAKNMEIEQLRLLAEKDCEAKEYSTQQVNEIVEKNILLTKQVSVLEERCKFLESLQKKIHNENDILHSILGGTSL